MGLAFESSSSASLLRTLLLLTSDNVLYVPLGVVARDGEGQAAWVHGGELTCEDIPQLGARGGDDYAAVGRFQTAQPSLLRDSTWRLRFAVRR